MLEMTRNDYGSGSEDGGGGSSLSTAKAPLAWAGWKVEGSRQSQDQARC